MPKYDVAQRLLDRVLPLLQQFSTPIPTPPLTAR
jgi:hypothetical protein